MMKTHYIVAFVLLLVCAGCEFIGMDSSDSEAYSYTAYDSTGAPVVKGTLRLTFIETKPGDAHPYRIEGSRDLEIVDDNAERIGPQVGKGEISGTISEDGRVWINLDPGWADNNVILGSTGVDGPFTKLVGDWNYVTFVGVSNAGRFELAD